MGALILVVTVILMASAPVAAQAQTAAKTSTAKAAGSPTAPKNWTVPKTPDGQPDLQGYWTSATTTPFERPANLATKEFYTEEEAKARVDQAQNRTRGATQAGTTGDVHYNFEQFGLDASQNPIVPNLRTSQVIDPPNGRLPAQNPSRSSTYRRPAGGQFDGPENRSLSERCIIFGGSTPIGTGGYNNAFQITQGAGYVMILKEMIHEARIIPLDGGPHLPSNVRQLNGDSRGHWEGNTLVVDTTNFTDRTNIQQQSMENLHLIERFTRTGPDTITYQYTVDDPSKWTKSWTAEFPIGKIDGPIFEYACQEGNYGLANQLSGARAAEREAEAAKSKQ
jgi:hypothetical protein